jgi:hypothetical protein
MCLSSPRWFVDVELGRKSTGEVLVGSKLEDLVTGGHIGMNLDD